MHQVPRQRIRVLVDDIGGAVQARGWSAAFSAGAVAGAASLEERLLSLSRNSPKKRIIQKL